MDSAPPGLTDFKKPGLNRVKFYIKSEPVSVGVSFNDRLNYIAYIVGKRIKYPNLK